MFSEQYLVDLVPISLCGNNVIMSMDCLSPSGLVIDCEQQLVVLSILVLRLGPLGFVIGLGLSIRSYLE